MMDLDALFGRINWHLHLPAYTDDKEEFWVMECLFVRRLPQCHIMMTPISYSRACVGAPEGLVHLHLSKRKREVVSLDGEAKLVEFDQPALDMWRPKIRSKSIDGWNTFSSQMELEWRRDLADLNILRADEKGEEEIAAVGAKKMKANDRALDLLLEHCNPQQRLELIHNSKFRVRGGRTGNMYQIELGNGFDLLHKLTDEILASYCLHPEYFMPEADVALATKLMLEDEELEEEVLTNARLGWTRQSRAITPEDRVAYKLELELI